jgi:hypothetical protein
MVGQYHYPMSWTISLVDKSTRLPSSGASAYRFVRL